MIMGGGKTSVVTPLLALFLADGSTLVLLCVPGPLLEMSRAATRAAFSSVYRRPVYTFTYDRLASHSTATKLGAKLDRAAAAGAVVVCSPTAIKVRLE